MRIFLIFLFFCVGCEVKTTEEAPPLVVAVLMPLPPSGTLVDLDWAVENVHAAGGVAGGRDLELRYVDTAGLSVDAVVAQAEALAADDTVRAVIGPGSSEEMLAVATVMVKAKKPLLSFTGTSSEVFRAFQGSKYIWRTKLTDTAQVEWLVRDAHRRGAQRLGLVTSLDSQGSTFFNLFAFLAVSQGYAEADLVIETYGTEQTCDAAVGAVHAAGVDYIIAVPNTPESFDCLVRAHDAHRARPAMPPPMPPGMPASMPPGMPPPVRLVIADTGLETNKPIAALGPVAAGIEGWNAAPDPESGFSEAWKAHFGIGHPNNAASAYDAVLLVALGLERSGGVGGEALADAIAAVAAGRGPSTGWNALGIAQAKNLMRQGKAPDITGASGSLDYDPALGVDLQSGTFAHWRVAPPLEYDQTVTLGRGAEPRPSLDNRAPPASFQAPPEGEEFVPAGAAERLQALIVAGSSGWDNYRHQADALRQYRHLRAAGVADADVVMVGADDLATAPENPRPGEVRNVPQGPDLYGDVAYDYGIGLTAEDLTRVLLGTASAGLPEVLTPDAHTNLLIFLVGHGGVSGLGLGADTTEAGVAGAGSSLRPSDLREALCTLRREGRVRRVLVVIESCYSGVFGDAEYGGIEAGCPDGLPLEGVLVVTAANTRESSLAAGYDADLAAWVGDEFALAFADRLELDPGPSLLGVYRETYLDVSGSHVSIYNTAAYGNLGRHFPDEFYRLP